MGRAARGPERKSRVRGHWSAQLVSVRIEARGAEGAGARAESEVLAGHAAQILLVAVYECGLALGLRDEDRRGDHKVRRRAALGARAGDLYLGAVRCAPRADAAEAEAVRAVGEHAKLPQPRLEAHGARLEARRLPLGLSRYEARLALQRQL